MSESDPGGKDRDELIADAKEDYEETTARHEAMLESVAEGEDFQVEEFEWVELGDLDLKVKTWFPGDVLEQFTDVSDVVTEQGEMAAASVSLDAALDALVEMTDVIDGPPGRMDTNEEIRPFWRSYFERFGDRGLDEAAETVFTPANEASDVEDAVKSFPAKD